MKASSGLLKKHLRHVQRDLANIVSFAERTPIPSLAPLIVTLESVERVLLAAVRDGVDVPFSASGHRSKMHCPQGHEYIGNNVIVDKNGHRQCRQCRRDQQRAHYYEHRQTICMARSEAARAKRTACCHGHPFTKGSFTIDGRGSRRCKICQSQRAKQMRQNGRAMEH